MKRRGRSPSWHGRQPACDLDTVGQRVVAPPHEHGMRNRVVVQARNMPERKPESGRGLAVGPVEGTILGGVLVAKHSYMEGPLDRRNRTFDLHLHAVAGASGNGKPIALRILDHRVIIRDGWAEPFGELRDGQEVPIGGTAWVIDLSEKIFQRRLIAQRQNDVQAKLLALG